MPVKNRPDWDRLISEREARKLAGDPSRTTVFRWEKLGQWPKAVPLGPNSKRYWLSEIMSTLESRRQDSDATA